MDSDDFILLLFISLILGVDNLMRPFSKSSVDHLDPVVLGDKKYILASSVTAVPEGQKKEGNLCVTYSVGIHIVSIEEDNAAVHRLSSSRRSRPVEPRSLKLVQLCLFPTKYPLMCHHYCLVNKQLRSGKKSRKIKRVTVSSLKKNRPSPQS